jgi:[ribosomal protein S5]-alanine N-acetyltransferase
MKPAELQTVRLSLSPLQPGDLESLHRHWTEPGVRRFLWDGLTITEEQTEEVIRTSDQLFRRQGAGLWTLRPPDRAGLLGFAGFWHFHEPPHTELVVSLSEMYWGQGFAREAAGVLLRYALNELEWPYVQGSADTPNVRSLKLMERIGMQPHDNVPGAFGAVKIYRITRERWLEVQGH